MFDDFTMNIVKLKRLNESEYVCVSDYIYVRHTTINRECVALNVTCHQHIW